jgi:hypothetical protein
MKKNNLKFHLLYDSKSGDVLLDVGLVILKCLKEEKLMYVNMLHLHSQQPLMDKFKMLQYINIYNISGRIRCG